VPESEQWDAVISLYEEGSTQAVINAAHLTVFTGPGGGTTHMDTVDADLYGESEGPSSHLTADAGEIYEQDREGHRRVKTWGDVLLVGTEGRTVRADTLWWDESGDRVYTDGPVEVTQEGDVLRGIGFEGDSRLEHFTIRRASGISPRGGRWLQDERSAPPPPASADSVSSVRPDTSVTAAADTSGAGTDP
jgi:LPS export ABC transporter protein LptC